MSKQTNDTNDMKKENEQLARKLYGDFLVRCIAEFVEKNGKNFAFEFYSDNKTFMNCFLLMYY